MVFESRRDLKSIAVGERCATPTEERRKESCPFKGRTEVENVTPSASECFPSPIRGRRATLAHGY